MSSEKDIDYYMNINWTLIEGTDTDFNGNPYYYVEIKEIPSFTYCAKTREKALANYKHQLKLAIMLMLEDGEEIIEPNSDGKYNGFSYELDDDSDTDWEEICP